MPARTALSGYRNGHRSVSERNREHRRLINKRRTQIATKAAACRRVAIQRGLRHAAVLVDKLAEYAALSDKLPWPSQETLATECGVTDRTIRYWLTALEDLGVIQVYRSKPSRQRDGTWNRQTNRYLLCDHRARATPPTMPLRRRKTRNTTTFSPTGKQLPLTVTELEPVGPSAAPGPQTWVVNRSVDISSPNHEPETGTKHTQQERTANRSGLREARQRLAALK